MIIEKLRELGMEITADTRGNILSTSPFSFSSLPLLVINPHSDTFLDLETGMKGDGEAFMKRLSYISKPVFSIEPEPRKEETEEEKRYKEIMKTSWDYYRGQIEKRQGSATLISDTPVITGTACITI